MAQRSQQAAGFVSGRPIPDPRDDFRVCPLLEDEPPFLPGNALEILRKHFVSFALKNEVHQHPTLTGHLEVETEVDKSKFLDV